MKKKKNSQKRSNPILQFLFPRNFMDEMNSARIKKQTSIVSQNANSFDLGVQRVQRHKFGNFWVSFWMWVPIVGQLFFMMQGKKEMKEIKEKKERTNL